MSLIQRDGSTTRLLPPAYFVVCLLLIPVLHFGWPGPRWLRYPWTLLGGIPLALGAALNLLADRSFRLHSTTVKPYEESAALITGGVFDISRNPMYVGMTMILAGVALFFGSLTPLLSALFFVVLMERRFIRVEERMLAARFGPAWEGYVRKTRRWL